MLRFDQNTPPLPLPSTRPGAIAGVLADVSSYPSDGYRDLRVAIARYAGVEPENVVARGGRRRPDPAVRPRVGRPGRHGRDPAAPTYPLYRIGGQLAGAEQQTATARALRSRSRAGRTTRPGSSTRSGRAAAGRRRGLLRVRRRDRGRADRRRRGRAPDFSKLFAPRRRAHRLRARLARRRRRAERATGAGGRVVALGGARARGAARPT